MGDSNAGAACADQQRPITLCIRQAAHEAFVKAVPVGVMANAAAVAEDDGIDRSKHAGVVRKFV